MGKKRDKRGKSKKDSSQSDSNESKESSKNRNKKKKTAATTAITSQSVTVATSLPALSTQSAVPAPRKGGPHSTVVIAAAVCLTLLVLVVVLGFIYKRFKCSKNTGNKEAQSIVDHGYDEIQERPQRSDTAPAMKTVYVTANFSTQSPAEVKAALRKNICGCSCSCRSQSQFPHQHSNKPEEAARGSVKRQSLSPVTSI
ncbi:uncharacterized protein LOC114451039 isoform X2 [Parambassis ranga]|uniref:Uncharacterized protein LOC114451039 isoform X2 n=1 Tax=Parambassis ranga TaxID=210632 RepID=A0A6P7K7F2_9TELE|nr:uncharacterized protein LOC114451039 isoform X2 [Parambassis ranga]